MLTFRNVDIYLARLDREKYVKIRWNNVNSIKTEFLRRIIVNYNEQGTNLYDQLLKIPYDYLSAANHDMHAYSKNKRPTVIPHFENGLKTEIGDSLRFDESFWMLFVVSET